MVRYQGTASNHIFEVLDDWERVLRDSSVYKKRPLEAEQTKGVMHVKPQP